MSQMIPFTVNCMRRLRSSQTPGGAECGSFDCKENVPFGAQAVSHAGLKVPPAPSTFRRFFEHDLGSPSKSVRTAARNRPARPPTADPGDVYGAAEVTRLAGGLASCSTPGGRTVALVAAVARIGTK